ncbi:Sid-1-related C [Gryllus bimaculatus]|nr:Sid-1-related C [Gryllus bimaculatus]
MLSYLFTITIIIVLMVVDQSYQNELLVRRDGRGLVNPFVLEGKYNKNYTFSVNDSREYIFQFDEAVDTPACITVECYDSNRTYPILIVVRQQKGVLSWQLPLIVETATSRREYYRTNRTLCPDNNYYLESQLTASSRDVIVSISTASPHNVTFSLLVKTVDNFFVQLSQTYDVLVSPSEPSYFAFKFQKEDPDTVLLQVDSKDEICTAVSVQDLTCPVFDLERNVQFEGYWQTISSQGSITLSRDAFPSGFYVVFVVKGDDYECSGKVPGYANSTVEPRRKNLTFSLSPGITYRDYILATLCTVAVFVVVYILCFVIAITYYVRRRRQPSEISYLDDDSCVSPSSTVPPTIYGQIQSPLSEGSTVLNQTGDQDLCYYNFLCAHPFGLLSDFNHVFSNIGYVLLGLLFILLTWRRDMMHRQSDRRLDKYYGIPQHYGLFYALGVALMMEGILSGCYHVCPNHSNFQFDTSFMYVIAMLCMLKIYQTRHPDINASAYSTFALLAVVIMVGMIGVLNGNAANWALAIYGLMYHLKDFATYLLSIFMANLLLYTMFYIVMKLCYREKILPQPLIYIILACVAWGAALYFFLNKSISWAVLLTLDDDLILVHRSRIPVF